MCKVSVIVPNYNHAIYLEQRIDSILYQTYQDFELILLDDCSTDNSREILSKYTNHPKVSHIVFNETNSGSTFKQWNKGIELAQGEYIWIAESDDWAESTFLEVLLHLISENPSAGLAFTLSNFVDQNGVTLWNIKESNDRQFYSGEAFIKNKLLTSNSINNVSMVVFRKSLYNKIDHTHYEEMKFCGDWFFYVLLCEHTNVVEYRKAYNNYRIHSHNISSKAEHEGLSFIEGYQILDYICSHYPTVKNSDYVYKYAKYWYTNQHQYQFSKKTNRQIIRTFRKSHKLIIIFYYLICIKQYIRSICNVKNKNDYL